MPEVLFNDASIEGQFGNAEAFRSSFGIVMRMREKLKSAGQVLKINKTLGQRELVAGITFQHWIFQLPRDQKQQICIWLSREGPFWDDPAVQPSNEYLVWDGDRDGDPVTDSALAEAACRSDNGGDIWLVSIHPSRYAVTPIVIWWEQRLGESESRKYELLNFWTLDGLEAAISQLPQQVKSWDSLLSWVAFNCPRLILSPNLKKQLGIEFISNVANRCQILLKALNDIADSIIKNDGDRFNALRSTWMEGEKARMTDAGAYEKAHFKADMTFRHPKTGNDVVCFWHGKVKTPQFRIHFEWPLPSDIDQLFVGYIGPKISKG